MQQLPEHHGVRVTSASRPVSASGSGHACRRQAARQQGVVLVITLLAIVLLAALVLYVFNLGQQTNDRIAAQNDADAAANAGAAWVARSLNTVSMNNVAMARLIANVAVLDSMPMAVEFTYKEQIDAHRTTDPQGVSQAISDQLSRGVSDWWVRDKLEEMLARIGRADDSRRQESAQRAQELRILESFENLFNTPQGDVTPLTFYNAPSGRGLLWQGMEALDELNQVTMENLGQLAQLSAVRAGQGGEVSTVMMLPVEAMVPYKRGTFRDFDRPVRQGLLPRDTDDKTTNRGPYDTIYGWRHPRGGRTTGYSRNTSIVGGSGRGNVPIGRGADGDYVVTGRSDATAYDVYGPYEWMMEQTRNMRYQSLRFSRFDHWMRTISDIKMNYAFRGGSIRTIIDPHWIIDYNDAKTIAQNNRRSVVETAFIVVEVKSRYPMSVRPPSNTPNSQQQADPSIPTPPEGDYWKYVTRHRPSQPWVTRQGGWVDPDSWTRAIKVDNNIWRDEWDYEVNFDRDIGIEPVLDANGRMIPQRVYRIDHYIFAGINNGEPVEVRNPFNFSNRNALPAPTELNLSMLGPNNKDARDYYLNFMTIVKHQPPTPLWPKLFVSDSPNPNNMAIAQAQVFNDHSWDLWTQMWRSQLSLIDTGHESGTSQFDNWVSRFEVTEDQARTIPNFTPQDSEDFLQYLRSLQPLAPVMLHH